MGIPTIPVSHNMLFVLDPRFGDFNRDIVSDIFRSVDTRFAEVLGTSQSSSTIMSVILYASDGIPMCSSTSENIHHIYLCCKGGDYSILMFQFAHEYCHHLIGGELKGGIEGLKWFEETVCEVASMYHLRRMISDWKRSNDAEKLHAVPEIQKYLEHLEKPSYSASSDILRHLKMEGWIEWYISCYKQRSRPSSNAVAVKMLPIFEANPHLWRIILHFGDMRRWKTLDELFQHLRKADSSYEAPLVELQVLLRSLY